MRSAALIVCGGLFFQLTAKADAGCSDCPGFALDAVYIGEYWNNTSGGLKTGDTYLDNLELSLFAEQGSLGIPGLSAKILALYNNGNQFSAEYVGDLQTVSNIDAPKGWRLYEAWLEWAPKSIRGLSVRTGIYAADQEFDVAPTNALFLHGAAGTGSEYALSGVNGPPIFPLSGFGVRVAGLWGENGYWKTAVMDGIPGNPDDPEDFYYRWNGDDGALLQAEVGVESDKWRKLAIGAWTYTTEQERLVTEADEMPSTERWSSGIYAIIDKQLFSGEHGDVAGFLRIGATKEGFANRGRLNVISRFLGGGLTWGRFFPGREDDELGLYVATAFADDELRDEQNAAGMPTERYETVIDLTYKIQISDWLSLQPDVQYIINPGLNPDFDNALVFGLRFQTEFGTQF